MEGVRGRGQTECEQASERKTERAEIHSLISVAILSLPGLTEKVIDG